MYNTFLSSLALMCLWPAFCWRLVAVISTGFCAVKTEFHSLLSQCWVFLRPSALRLPFIYRRYISISMHKLFAWDIFPHARSHHSQMTGHRLYSMHEPPNTHTHRPTQSKQQMSSLEAFCTQKQQVLCHMKTQDGPPRCFGIPRMCVRLQSNTWDPERIHALSLTDPNETKSTPRGTQSQQVGPQ